MAKIAGIYVPDGGGASSTADITAALATVTSSAEIVLGPNRIFNITATGALTIRFGVSGMPAASAADFQIPANTVMTFSLGPVGGNDRIRVFNTTASSITYWIQPLHA